MSIQAHDIQRRVRQLQAEISKGERQLEALQQRRVETEQTLLRLSGAVQVLTELLDQSPDTHQTARHEDAADSTGAESARASARAAGG